MNNKFTLHYADKEWYSYDNINKRYYFIDFYIKELNLGIEFNGDMWHANPDIYKENDIPFPYHAKRKSIDIWNQDKIKNDYLKTKLNKLIIIWEQDLNKNGIDKTVNDILLIIENEKNKIN